MTPTIWLLFALATVGSVVLIVGAVLTTPRRPDPRQDQKNGAQR